MTVRAYIGIGSNLNDHYVTRISHRDDLNDLVQKGADLEKVVLSRAVKWHIDNRILVYGNKTVVFD